MVNITKDTLYSNIDGLASQRNTPITKVTLNNSEMEVTDLLQFPQFSQELNGQPVVTVDNFLDYMDDQQALGTEFFNESTSRLVDGHLTIEPRNVGSKG